MHDYDNSERLKPAREEPKRTLSEKRGSAAEEGFTVVGRRPRDSQPGDIMPTDQADALEDGDFAHLSGMFGPMRWY